MSETLIPISRIRAEITCANNGLDIDDDAKVKGLLEHLIGFLDGYYYARVDDAAKKTTDKDD